MVVFFLFLCNIFTYFSTLVFYRHNIPSCVSDKSEWSHILQIFDKKVAALLNGSLNIVTMLVIAEPNGCTHYALSFSFRQLKGKGFTESDHFDSLSLRFN